MSSPDVGLKKSKKSTKKITLAETVVRGFDSCNNKFNNSNSARADQSSLKMNQTFSSHSIIHIALSCITLPLAVANLIEQYKYIKELKNKNLTQFNQSESLNPHQNRNTITSTDDSATGKVRSNNYGGSPFFQESHRTPETINKHLIAIKKAQLTSTTINVIFSLILTGVVISAIFTGGLSLGVLALGVMIMTSIKIIMDVYLANKEANLKKEFFESKVLIQIERLEPEVHEQYERLIAVKDKTVIMASIALAQHDSRNYPDLEVIEYILNQRQGYFENAKMRNVQIGFGILGLGMWIATNYLTLGLAGVVLSVGATTLSIAASIINTEWVQNALGPNIPEWFRTFFSKKEGVEFDLYDYKNKEIISFITDIKTTHDSVANFLSNYSLLRAESQLSSPAMMQRIFHSLGQTNKKECDKETSEPNFTYQSIINNPSKKHEQQNTFDLEQNQAFVGRKVNK